MGALASEYTVHDNALGSRYSTSGSYASASSNAKSGTRPTAPDAPPVTMMASPAVIASSWNWVPAGSPRTSPATGRTTDIDGSPAAGPAAVRNVCSIETAPASVRSGQGSPVRPAATES